MGATDYGRDAIDQIVRDLGNSWWAASREIAPIALQKGIRQAANKFKVQEEYLLWILLSDRKSWAFIPSSGLLFALVRLYLDNPRTSGRLNSTPPETLEEEGRVNKALVHLVQWANSSYKDVLTRMFVDEAIPAAKEVQKIRETSSQEARLILAVELPLRVQDHPHWFRDVFTIQLMAEGVLG